jgi:ribose/xylose/arabinose/galactoside ABC-type transport system permease subunit
VGVAVATPTGVLVGVLVGVTVGVLVGVFVGVGVAGTPSPTSVVALAELFPLAGSKEFVLTDAVLVSRPGVIGAVTTIVITGAVPEASDVAEQVTTPEASEQLHPVPDAETNAVPAGSVSVTVA